MPYLLFSILKCNFTQHRSLFILSYSLLTPSAELWSRSKWKCAVWVCLLTGLCCHFYAYVPAMPGLRKKENKIIMIKKKPPLRLNTVVSAEMNSILALASWQKLNMLGKKKKQGFQSCCGQRTSKRKKNKDLWINSEMWAENLVSSLMHTPHHHLQSQHYSWCWWSILDVLCLWQLNFHSCCDSLETLQRVREALAICFCLTLRLQQLGFLSDVLQLLEILSLFFSWLFTSFSSALHLPCVGNWNLMPWLCFPLLLVSQIQWMIKVFPLHCGGKQREASGCGTDFSQGICTVCQNSSSYHFPLFCFGFFFL